MGHLRVPRLARPRRMFGWTDRARCGTRSEKRLPSAALRAGRHWPVPTKSQRSCTILNCNPDRAHRFGSAFCANMTVAVADHLVE